MQNQVIKLSKAQVIKFTTLILVLGLGGVIYFAEAIIFFTAPDSKADAIRKLRQDGVNAYPAMTSQIILLRNNMQPLQSQSGKPILPFGGIADKKTVFCREAGELIQYNSDRFGFRNPDELWDSQISIAAIGDSYVQGACMDDDKHFVGQLRNTWPKTLNLGSFGNGPLSNLGTIEEYVLARKPDLVLWFYVANDLAIDLPLEQSSEILRSYMKPGFRQNLAERQIEIDQALDKFLIAEIDRLDQDKKAQPPFVSLIKLTDLQDRIRLLSQRIQLPPAPDQPAAFDYDRPNHIDYDKHSRIVADAASRVRRAGGKLIFVLVPDARMYRPVTDHSKQPQQHVNKMAASIAAYGIPVINLHEEFVHEKNPMQFYAPMGSYYGHFNENGYARASRALIRELKKVTAISSH